jgi:hypothetical protein
MLEGVALIILYVLIGITSMLALILIVISVFRQSKNLFVSGLITAMIPLSLYALSYWYYKVRIPELIRQEENSYAGTYRITDSDSTDTKDPFVQITKITLYADNTFQLDKNDFTPFHGKGTWRAGATDDGQFEFRDSKKSVVFMAMPSNNSKLEINKHYKDRKTIVFQK